MVGTALAGSALPAWADGDDATGLRINQLHLETRMGFEGDWLKGKTQHDQTGFKGQYLNLRLDGQITKGLTFSYRQRLNKNTDQTFWDATDWLHLDYKPTKHWELSAGKQVVWIGGYEYDRAPIDLYQCSEYWQHIPCYQLGFSGAYIFNPDHKLLIQMTNSPFRAWAGNNTYAFNLIWYGRVGWWESIWSTNMMEYARGKWINYIALGNKFNITDGLHAEVDLVNRASSHQTFFFRDFSVIGELSYAPHESVRTFAKYSFDQNLTHTNADLLVAQGVKMQMAAMGIEVNPIKKYREGIRLFASAGYSWGQNPPASAVWHNHEWKMDVGVKWRLDVLDAAERIVRKIKK